MYATALQLVLVLAAIPGPDDQARKIVARLNTYRKAAGLGPVVLDAKLSRGCRAHARYIARHFDPARLSGFNGHVEDPKLDGYTEEGHQAAQMSEIHMYTGSRSPLGSVDGYMACFFHRISLIRPDLERVGFAQLRFRGNWKVVVLDTKSGREKRSEEAGRTVVYPVDEQTGVPLAFAENEIPNPIPRAGRGRRAGFPITVTFPQSAGVTEASALLRDAHGRQVAVWFSSPEKPAYKPEFQLNTVCLIPKSRLRPSATYRVTVTAKVDGKAWSRDWSFTTK